MVWVANLNAGPISYNYDASGNPVPIASDLNIGGIAWYAASLFSLYQKEADK